MNEEVKEILDNIDIWYKENDLDYTRWFGLEELKQLKDYITNLQEENEHLNTKLNTYKDEFCKDTIKNMN